MGKSLSRLTVLQGASLLALATPALAQTVPTAPPAADPATQDVAQEPGSGLGDIVVTARRREEGLLSVPVSVTAIGTAELKRYNADTLEKVGELTPGVLIGQNKTGGGGSISLRGISTSAATAGFEQPVLINIDGLPVSSGRVVAVGFFDLQRVEVLKGPQALLFGKNNTAGVMSLVSTDPGARVEGYSRVGYEFVADEVTVESALGGPLTDTLGARIAVRMRSMKGWLYNNSRAIANPFAPALPLQDPDHRLGDRDVAARVTLKYTPTSDFSATFKLMGSKGSDDGTGVSNQVVGCINAKPAIRNIIDPLGECKRDNHTTSGLPNATVVANGPYPAGATGKDEVLVSSLGLNYRTGPVSLVSTTGYFYLNAAYAGANDISSYAQLFGAELSTIRSFSQEVRALTAFESGFNFMIGAFYQDLDVTYEQRIKLSDTANFNPANGKYIAWIRPSYTHGKTYSAFGQLIVTPLNKVELAGGARWTHETKDSFTQNIYAFQPTFPDGKSLSDRYSENNISPEVTLTWRPNGQSSVYAAYRSGFKSGGFGLSGSVQTTTRASDLAFGSERARGFEVGAKGLVLDGKLRLEAVAYSYRYSDLQVNAFNPTTVSFTFANAARLKQEGIDLQALYQPTREVQLHAAVNYNRNRFGPYFAQCYGAQTAAQGCNVLPGPTQNLTGRVSARSPDWSGNAGAVWDIPLGAGRINLSGDAFYTSGYFGSETLAPATYQTGFWRFNASVNFYTAEDRFSVGLVGRNLSNRYYLLTAQDKTNQAGDMRGTVARGREILLQAGYRF